MRPLHKISDSGLEAYLKLAINRYDLYEHRIRQIRAEINKRNNDDNTN